METNLTNVADTEVNRKLAFIVDRSPDYITLISRDYRYEVVNRSYCEAMEKNREEILGRTVSEVWGDDSFHRNIKHHIDQCLTGKPINYVARFYFGPFERTMQVIMSPYPDNGENVTHVLVVSRDITRFGRIESMLNSYEFYDPTTGILNRRSLETMLEREIAAADLSSLKTDIALLYIRLNGLGEVNRLYGYRFGDLLLEDTAVRIKGYLKPSGEVFRFEGSQLAVLIPDVHRKSDIGELARSLGEAIGVPYRFKEHVLAVTPNIGISIFPDDGAGVADLVQHAVSACMEAQSQNELFLMYNRQLHEDAVLRMKLVSDLHAAFEHGEFELHYQPIVQSDGHIVGAEALVRWNHPELGLLQPGQFVSLAEESGLVMQLGRWVMFTATRQLAEWSDRSGFYVTVNLSAEEFGQENLADIVTNAMRSAGVGESWRLKLEITESRCMSDPEAAIAQMRRLSSLSVDLWIDDFGTGYSSLSYLKWLPARVLKLDRTFVKELDDSPEDIVYVTSILNSVRSRAKETVVEGVETASQHSILKRIGCERMQGFYFGKPVPAAEFSKMLESDRPLPL